MPHSRPATTLDWRSSAMPVEVQVFISMPVTLPLWTYPAEERLEYRTTADALAPSNFRHSLLQSMRFARCSTSSPWVTTVPPVTDPSRKESVPPASTVTWRSFFDRLTPDTITAVVFTVKLAVS